MWSTGDRLLIFPLRESCSFLYFLYSPLHRLETVERVKAAQHVNLVSPGHPQEREFRVFVVFTDFESTNAALTVAAGLARDLDARVVLLVPKLVPYPLPLEAPPVDRECTDRMLSKLIGLQEREIAVRVYLCRDSNIAIKEALELRSVVVIGGCNRWLPNRASSLARLLKRRGHEVIRVGCRPMQSSPIAVAHHRTNS